MRYVSINGVEGHFIFQECSDIGTAKAFAKAESECYQKVYGKMPRVSISDRKPEEMKGIFAKRTLGTTYRNRLHERLNGKQEKIGTETGGVK